MNNNLLTLRVAERNLLQILSAISNMEAMRTNVFTYEQSRV